MYLHRHRTVCVYSQYICIYLEELDEVLKTDNGYNSVEDYYRDISPVYTSKGKCIYILVLKWSLP